MHSRHPVEVSTSSKFASERHTNATKPVAFQGPLSASQSPQRPSNNSQCVPTLSEPAFKAKVPALDSKKSKYRSIDIQCSPDEVPSWEESHPIQLKRVSPLYHSHTESSDSDIPLSDMVTLQPLSIHSHSAGSSTHLTNSDTFLSYYSSTPYDGDYGSELDSEDGESYSPSITHY